MWLFWKLDSNFKGVFRRWSEVATSSFNFSVCLTEINEGSTNKGRVDLVSPASLLRQVRSTPVRYQAAFGKGWNLIVRSYNISIFMAWKLAAEMWRLFMNLLLLIDHGIKRCIRAVCIESRGGRKALKVTGTTCIASNHDVFLSSLLLTLLPFSHFLANYLVHHFPFQLDLWGKKSRHSRSWLRTNTNIKAGWGWTPKPWRETWSFNLLNLRHGKRPMSISWSPTAGFADQIYMCYAADGDRPFIRVVLGNFNLQTILYAWRVSND